MAYVPPIMLNVRTRELIRPGEDETRQIVEVLKGDEVIGQLPVTRAVYEMLPAELGTLRLDIIVKRAEIEGYA